MDTWPYVMALSILLLLICSSIASAIETAMTASSRIKLQSLADNGNKKAKLALKLKDGQQKVVSTTLIMNNVVNICLSTIATLFFTIYYKNIPLPILTAILTIAILILGEITPKTLASNNPEKFVMFYVSIIIFFTKILTPIVSLLNFISNILLKPFHIDVNLKEDLVTEEELKTMVDISHEEGVIEEEEKEIMHNLFEFGDLTLKDIMIPRVDMVMLKIDSTYDEILEIFKNERYTRIPIYDENQDNVVGIINIKDFFLYDTNKKKFDIKNIMRDAFFLYENKKVTDTLTEMRNTSNNFVIVLDEYGSTVGMVTLEDILEEIVGDIRDEFDEDEENAIIKINDNEYVIAGSTKTDDINEKLDINIQNDAVDSIGGVIISNISQIPQIGNEVICGENNEYKLKVEEMDNNRITKVRLFILNNLEKNDN